MPGSTLPSRFYIIDAVPTDGSTNAVSSDGVFDQLALKAPAFGALLVGSPVQSSFRLGTTTDAATNGMNLHIPSATSASFFSNIVQLLVGSGTNSQARRIMRGSVSPNLGVDNDAFGTLHGTEAYIKAPTGTHPLIASMVIKVPTITGSGATVTRAATLIIDGAPTGGISNDALFITGGTITSVGLAGTGIRLTSVDANGTMSTLILGTNLSITGSTLNSAGGSGGGDVTLTGTQTLTNKTLTSPVVNTPTGIVKDDVGLDKVDNTTDLVKPISTATKAALDLKVAFSLSVYAALGGTIKAEPINCNAGQVTSPSTFIDGQVRFVCVYLPVAATITGVKWYQIATGVYTADNYNGVGLYTYSGGTLTLVASSTNDGNTWKAGANTWSSKAFSSTYAADAGVYFVCALYNSSAQTTAPTLGVGTGLVNAAASAVDFTNGAKLSSTVSALTALPATQAMTGVTASNSMAYLALY